MRDLRDLLERLEKAFPPMPGNEATLSVIDGKVAVSVCVKARAYKLYLSEVELDLSLELLADCIVEKVQKEEAARRDLRRCYRVIDVKVEEVPLHSIKKGELFLLKAVDKEDELLCHSNELNVATSDAYVNPALVDEIQCDVVVKDIRTALAGWSKAVLPHE